MKDARPPKLPHLSIDKNYPGVIRIEGTDAFAGILAGVRAPEIVHRCNCHEALVAALEGMLALTEPWPLRDAVAKLVEGAEHLLRAHMCDRHGHEELAVAMQTAAALLPKIDAAQRVLLEVSK